MKSRISKNLGLGILCAIGLQYQVVFGATSGAKDAKDAVTVGAGQGVVGKLVETTRKQTGQVPQAIYRYFYNDKVAYLVEPGCCDHFSFLYDESGRILCAPHGGFAGSGDGKCADFDERKKGEKLLWKP